MVLLSAATAQTIISMARGRVPESYMIVNWGPTAVSWTQTNRFTNVTVSAGLVRSEDSGEETAWAYLTTRIGFGTTANDTIASNLVAYPLTLSNVVLFSGLTLDPGTYYLSVIGTPDAGSGRWISGCTVHLERAAGVTLGPEYDLQGGFDFYEMFAQERAPMTQHFSVVSGTNPVYVPVPTSPVNAWPVATPQQITVIENTPRTFTLDVLDPDGDQLGINCCYVMPTNGTVRAEGVANDPEDIYNVCFPLTELTYTPVENYLGSDYFEYTVQDWHDASLKGAFVAVEVVPPPLGLSLTGVGLRLSWTANCPHYDVEKAASLDGGWQTVEEPRSAEGDQLAVIVNPAETQGFFRLRRTIPQ